MSVLKPYFKIKENVNDPIKKPQTKNTKNKAINRKDINQKSFYGYTPLDLAQFYNFPDSDGEGQTVGIIELGGGYNRSDITTYLSDLGITTPINLSDVGIDGATNNISDTSGANYEVTLDIEIIIALVPKANIQVYFAPNSFIGFYNAISRAISDNCNVISISWGAPEIYWSETELNSLNTLFKTATENGITVFAASGDKGSSSDGVATLYVDFPSSSPFVVSCGGTTLTVNNSNMINEVVWNGSGGGVSNFFPKPSYQNNIDFLKSLNKRGTPDICGNADPNTGYKIYIDGQYMIIGGTSAVSPLWSGLIARINTLNSSSIGFLQNKLYYSNGNVCKDITSGNNGYYMAQTNWDCCTGWGSPCSTLTQFLQNISLIPHASFSSDNTSGVVPLTIQFTDTSTNSPTTWLWSFGNGDVSDLQNPLYTFNTPGTFNVSLIVSNNYGSNTISKTISVTTTATRPLTKFNALSINFVNTSLNNPTSFLWDFGDHNTSTERNPTHVYSKPGNYTVKLTSSNSAGSNTFTKIITLK